MKSYTTIEQSRKLAEILPLESADMEYMFLKRDGSKVSNVPFVKDGFEEPECCYIFIPCWSLAALLYIIQETTPYTMQNFCDEKLQLVCVLGDKPWELIISDFNNEVDACYEMIIKLHELNLL